MKAILKKNKVIISTLLALLLLGGCQGNSAEKDPSITRPDSTITQPEIMDMETWEFDFEGEKHQIQTGIAPSAIEKLSTAPHLYSYQGHRPPPNWKEEFYKMFLTHPADESACESVLGELRKLKPGATDDEMVEMASAFVQGAIEYDWLTFYNLEESQIRYPSQTLVARTGVCADKSILLARLLGKLGYDLVAFAFKQANHIALGIRVPDGYGDYGTNYAFVESTNYAPVGRIPERYAGGTKLDRKPEIIKLLPFRSKTFHKIVQNKVVEKDLEEKYGKEYLFLPLELQGIRRKMAGLEVKLDALKKEAKGCSGTLSQTEFDRCQKLTNEINAKVEEYNSLVNEFNAKVAARNGQV
ncbi:MAG: hypothetical protein H6581_12975 [Bacteroidia bacterium]|nr:hypothetical protein [Bacteroidia bacterium]